MKKKIIDSEKIFIKREEKEGKTAPRNRTPPLIKLILIRITNFKIKSRHYSRHQSLEQTLKHNKNENSL